MYVVLSFGLVRRYCQGRQSVQPAVTERWLSMALVGVVHGIKIEWLLPCPVRESTGCLRHLARRTGEVLNRAELTRRQDSKGKKVVHPGRVELPTYRSVVCRSIQLSYGCTLLPFCGGMRDYAVVKEIIHKSLLQELQRINLSMEHKEC